MNLDHIPGTMSFLETPRMLGDPVGFITKRHRTLGNVFKTRLGMPTVFLLGPEANKSLLVTQRHAFSHKGGYGTTPLIRLFENSLIVLDGEEHKHDRDILQPAMARVGLTDSLGPMLAAWQATAATLGDGQSRDVYTFMQRTTFEVSANVLMGFKLGDELEAVFPLFEQLIAGSMTLTPFRVPFGKLDRALKARQQLMDLLVPRVEEMRRQEPVGLAGRLAHHRNEEGQSIPAARVVEHLLLLFWAGYDTTASTGGWVLHELANHPAWQETLLEEQLAVLADAPLNLDAMNLLPRQQFFLREVERFRPVVLFFPRLVTQDVEVEGFNIPAGVLAFYSPYATHRMENLFHDAHVFDPWRWDGTRHARPAQATMLVGFGGGPRICLGGCLPIAGER